MANFACFAPKYAWIEKVQLKLISTMKKIIAAAAICLIALSCGPKAVKVSDPESDIKNLVESVKGNDEAKTTEVVKSYVEAYAQALANKVITKEQFEAFCAGIVEKASVPEATVKSIVEAAIEAAQSIATNAENAAVEAKDAAEAAAQNAVDQANAAVEGAVQGAVDQANAAKEAVETAAKETAQKAVDQTNAVKDAAVNAAVDKINEGAAAANKGINDAAAKANKALGK